MDRIVPGLAALWPGTLVPLDIRPVVATEECCVFLVLINVSCLDAWSRAHFFPKRKSATRSGPAPRATTSGQRGDLPAM